MRGTTGSVHPPSDMVLSWDRTMGDMKPGDCTSLSRSPSHSPCREDGHTLHYAAAEHRVCEQDTGMVRRLTLASSTVLRSSHTCSFT